MNSSKEIKSKTIQILSTRFYSYAATIFIPMITILLLLLLKNAVIYNSSILSHSIIGLRVYNILINAFIFTIYHYFMIKEIQYLVDYEEATFNIKRMFQFKKIDRRILHLFLYEAIIFILLFIGTLPLSDQINGLFESLFKYYSGVNSWESVVTIFQNIFTQNGIFLVIVSLISYVLVLVIIPIVVLFVSYEIIISNTGLIPSFILSVSNMKKHSKTVIRLFASYWLYYLVILVLLLVTFSVPGGIGLLFIYWLIFILLLYVYTYLQVSILILFNQTH